MAFINSKGGGGRNSKRASAKENVVFYVDHFVAEGKTVDGSRKTLPDPVNDHVVARLAYSTRDVAAETDENYLPSKIVHIYLNPPSEEKVDPSGKPRRGGRSEILDKKVGRPPMGKAVQQGGMMVLENAVLDEEKSKVAGVPVYTGGWLTTLTDRYDPDINYPFRGWIRVGQEQTAKKGGGSEQKITIVGSDRSVSFSGLDDFMRKSVEVFDDIRDLNGTGSVGPGSPFLTIRAIGKTPTEKGFYQVKTDRIYLGWDESIGGYRSSSDAIKYFISVQNDKADDESWTKAFSDDSLYFEIVPSCEIKVGSFSLPSARREAGQKGQVDASEACHYPVPYDYTNRDGVRKTGVNDYYGYIHGDVFGTRKSNEEGSLPWYATYAGPSKLVYEIRNPREFPSAALMEAHPEIEKAFSDRGVANSKASYDARRNVKEEHVEPDDSSPLKHGFP